ncbi:MAG: hypothetical protein WCF03_15620 [Nitrososphaeraceae archaeon]
MEAFHIAVEYIHGNDTPGNHPILAAETLHHIAGYFKDGYVKFKN